LKTVTVELSRREVNVLRRLLNRPEIRPQDVARLGLARLESAQGLGVKGREHVLDWLGGHGFNLRPPDSGKLPKHDRINRRLEQAQHLLEQWGWQVKRPERDNASPE
jgi:hypothetical protein